MTTTTHRRSPRTTLLVLAGAATVALAGCGSVADTAAEQVVEQAIENSTDVGGSEGTDVGLDSDTGEFSIDVEGSEGGSLSIGGGEIPDTFPEQFVLPDDGEVRAVTELQGAVGVQVTAGADALEALEATQAALVDDDWQAVTESTAGDLRQATYRKGDLHVTIGALGQGDEYVLTYNYLTEEFDGG